MSAAPHMIALVVVGSVDQLTIAPVAEENVAPHIVVLDKALTAKVNAVLLMTV